MTKNILYITLLLTVLNVSCKDDNYINTSNNNAFQNTEIIKDSELYKAYINKYKNKEILIYSEGDFNGDNNIDLVIIYRESKYENKLIGIYENDKNKILMTTPIPAPIENYVLRFYDIDEKAPKEILVSGQKGANIGFAVYRLEKGEFISLFENGMEKCC